MLLPCTPLTTLFIMYFTYVKHHELLKFQYQKQKKSWLKIGFWNINGLSDGEISKCNILFPFELRLDKEKIKEKNHPNGGLSNSVLRNK